jgi:meso-butanediol dehydrogenase / (S,S)-butanediol dehydrogenase / diacetyl reductase
MGRLSGKVAVITGASSGIGWATALLFAKEGARVVVAARREDKLKELAAQMKKLGGEAIYKATDVSKEEDVKALAEATIAAFGTVDILVNNAGMGGDMVDLEHQDAKIWRDVYQTNVLSAVLATKHLVRYMIEKKSGSIVNISSVAGIRSGAGGNAYSASKAAMINFTMTSACDLGCYNVRVNCVCPGLFETEMTQKYFDAARAKGKIDMMGSRCELRRYGNSEECAYPILFLASDEASFITGQYLAVDGGNTASLNMPGMKV